MAFTAAPTSVAIASGGGGMTRRSLSHEHVHHQRRKPLAQTRDAGAP